MIMRIYVLFDAKAEQWMTPFFSKTNGTVFREIQSNLAQAPKDDVVASNRGDFELYCIGVYNQVEGILTSVPPEKLGTLLDVTA